MGALLFSTTVRANETDDRIESAATKSYVYKTYLKDDAIKTTSKNGVVTLTGTVYHVSHKSLAEDTVENLPGVTKVDNQLTLNAEGPAEKSDGWLSAKVKTTLLFHRNVSASATDVFVKDGVVSLRGEASSVGQKELTTEYAKDIEGVKEVKNEMTIAKEPLKPFVSTGESIDDASITAQVKSSLTSRRSISSLKIRVATNEGVVTLTGIARNDAEKSLVTKLVDDIYGVSKVVNNMTIEVAAASNI
jgi:osmotically-inducible protein OsmY